MKVRDNRGREHAPGKVVCADSGRPPKGTEALDVGVRLNGSATGAEVGLCFLPVVVLKLYGVAVEDISFPVESNNLYDTIEQPFAVF